MRTNEYLVILKNDETLEVIDTFYIAAFNIKEANKIASDLMHDYDNVDYYKILSIIEHA